MRKQSWKAIYAQAPALLAFSLAFRLIAGAPLLLTPPYRDLYADDHPFIALMKGTQVFGTEYLMNSALFWAFSGRARGATIMFLPTSELVRDFVQLRLDPAIAADPDLRAALTAPAGTAPNRLGLKQFARGHLLVHGADSYRQLAANPADGLCIDEYDLMAADVLPQMLQRLGSSPESRVRVASTPRLAGTGIDALYQQGTQFRYHYPCPACGLNQALEWPDSVLREAAVLGCRRCRAFMDLYAEGEWLAGAPDQETIHSYHLPRWYSPVANIPQILREADSDTFGTEQTFANYIAAEVYAPDGSQLTLPDLDAVRRPYGLEDTYRGQPCDMGIDVGKRLHVVIREARQAGGPFPRQLRFAGEVTFPELDALVERRTKQDACSRRDARPIRRAARFVVSVNRQTRRVVPSLSPYSTPDHPADGARIPEASLAHLSTTVASVGRRQPPVAT